MKRIIGNKDFGIIINFGLYGLISAIGIFLMKYPAIGTFDPVYYVSGTLYMISLLCLLAFFIDIKESDYENLFLALLFVIIASVYYIFKSDNNSFLLGTGIVALTIGIFLNKGYKVYMLSEERNNMWFIKFVVTFIIAFLGILITVNLYKELTAPTMVFGYYFLTFGIVNLFDPVYALLLKNKSFESYMKDILEEEIENESTYENISIEKNNEEGEEIKVKKVAKKPATKKPAVKKAVAKKPTKKVAAKKPAVKKVVAKKPTTKKPAVKKAVAKKPAKKIAKKK